MSETELSREPSAPQAAPFDSHTTSASNSLSDLDVTVDLEPKDGYFPYNEEKTLQHVRPPRLPLLRVSDQSPPCCLD